MTDRRDMSVDPLEIGDTEEKLDHTGGAEALDREVTAADEDYVRRHTAFNEADGDEAGTGDRTESSAKSRDGDDKSSPVNGSTGAVASTGKTRGGT